MLERQVVDRARLRLIFGGSLVKNGLLTYSDKYPYFNVGDYIQSLAAKQFFDEIDIYINREKLRLYDAGDVKIILNGWFMHQPENWPPSSQVHPLFVAFHINSVAHEKLTTPESIAYLKQHSPVGCRDHNTVKVLRGFGVDAYFSGCLTLSLGKKYHRTVVGQNVYFVDPHFKSYKDLASVMGYFKLLLSHSQTIYKIATNMYGSLDLRRLLKAAAFYKSYSGIFSDEVLVNAVFINQELKNSEIDGDKAKFELAEKLLLQYSAAKFVVTSRIHCALPCLGMGTPVLYVDDQQQSETSYCRLSGLKELFHIVSCDGSDLSCDLTSNKISLDFSFTNKPDYKAVADALIQTCTAFVAKAP